jgi:hypothetical protein
MAKLQITIVNLVRLGASLAILLLPIVSNANLRVEMIISCLPLSIAVLLFAPTATMVIPRIIRVVPAYIIP